MCLRYLAGIVFAVLLPACLNAQFNSSIEGTVTDRGEAVVSQANVTVTNIATGVARQATTSSDGFYRIVDLGPGTYRVRVEHAGFRISEQTDIALAGSQTIRVNASLEVGTLSQKITVEAQVPLVETEQGRISGSITTKELQELPLNGRNIYNVVA